MNRLLLIIGLLALSAICWVAFSSAEEESSLRPASQDSRSLAAQRSSEKGAASKLGVQRAIVELDSPSGFPDVQEPPLESTHVPWWENGEFVSRFKEEFPDFAAEHPQDWDSIAETVDKNLENLLLTSGLLLEDRRLFMSDFESLSTQEKTGAVALLSTVSGSRMSLGIDPFGEREFEEKEKLETKILANGLAYSPQAMVDASSFRTGRVLLEGTLLTDFSDLRLEFLLEASRLEARISDRGTVAVEYLALNARESLMRDGLNTRLRMPDLDDEWLMLMAQKEELAARYRNAVQNFLLENSSN
jgi:hypothetical protein